MRSANPIATVGPLSKLFHRHTYLRTMCDNCH